MTSPISLTGAKPRESRRDSSLAVEFIVRGSRRQSFP
jgi:hypothetical protein